MRTSAAGRSWPVPFGVLLVMLCLALAASTLFSAGCGQGSTVSTAQQAEKPGDSKPVSFTTEDGVTLTGHLFGSGDAGIVLAHMYPADQTSWNPAAQRLAEEGYLVLTFDFRGYGESEGNKDIAEIGYDAIAALLAIADAGAGRVAIIGASMGGTASLIAADYGQSLSRFAVSGVATLSAPVEFRGLSAEEAVPRIQIPMLFIAAEEDTGADGARELEKLSGDRGELHILPGNEHGTNMLDGETADQVWELLLGFLDQNLGGGP